MYNIERVKAALTRLEKVSLEGHVGTDDGPRLILELMWVSSCFPAVCSIFTFGFFFIPISMFHMVFTVVFPSPCIR